MADHRRDNDRDHGNDHGNRGQNDHDHRPRPQLIEPQFVTAGLPMQGQRVMMANRAFPLIPETAGGDGPAIFTRGLAACQSIATFNMASGDRTLIHLPGGATTEWFNNIMASIVAGAKDIVVFIVNGDAGTKSNFEQIEVPKFKKDIDDALRREGNERVIPLVKWITLWTDKDEDEQKRTVPGTFVLEASGRYGRGKFD